MPIVHVCPCRVSGCEIKLSILRSGEYAANLNALLPRIVVKDVVTHRAGLAEAK
jgi:hypothetical protein